MQTTNPQKIDLDYGMIKLVEYLTLPKSLRKMNFKRFAEEELGVSEQTAHRWKNLPHVQEMLQHTAHDWVTRLQRDIPDILWVQRNKALMGNTSSARLMLKYLGAI